MDVIDLNSLMSETELRELSKALGSRIPKKDESLAEEAFLELESSFRRILHTVGSAKLSVTHGAAAWNCLYGFLEQGIGSSDQQLRDLCFASKTWIEVYERFISRSQNNKSKPMKQVLLTLIKVLTRNPVEAVRYFLTTYIISSTTVIICTYNDFPSVKPAFQVLELLLNKSIIRAADIVFHLVRKGSLRRQSQSLDIVIEEADRSSVSQQLQLNTAQIFVSDILAWVRYPDVAPVGGRLIVAFFKSLQAHTVDEGRNLNLDQSSPIWVKPVIELLEREPSLTEIFENHILPGLLMLIDDCNQPFLGTNLLQDLRSGNAEKHSVIAIQLCLLTLKLRMEINSPIKSGNALLKAEKDIECETQDIALSLMGHSSASIRIASLSIIAHYPTSIEAFSPRVLECLQQFIPHFQTEANPRVRNEFIVIIKKVCARLERGFSLISKSHQAQPSPTSASEASTIENIDNGDSPFKKHISFSKWYIGFLTNELQPTASYQRHIVALKILESTLHEGIAKSDSSKLFNSSKIVDDGFIEESRPFFDSRFIRLVLDLFMDPFDDVRLTAGNILRLVLWNQYCQIATPWTRKREQVIYTSIHYLGRNSRQTYHANILQVLSRAESIMYRTGRADHADGVGRLYNLLYESCQNLNESTIETPGAPVLWSSSGWSIIDYILSELNKNIIITRQDIYLAVGSASLHGSLIALRNIICGNGYYDLYSVVDSDWRIRRSVNDRILGCCIQVWEVVKGVLCYDSPEGYTVGEDENADFDVGTKDVLSFSWRALKESSTLMNLMIMLVPNSPDSGLGMRYIDLQTVGDLAFSQLAELRHRGAFSSVSQTFSSCCKRCVEAMCRSPIVTDPLIRDLPKKWYQDALEIIERNASTLTRRSAGLPSIIVGILSAFPEGDFFDSIILDLQAIANAPLESVRDIDTRLPQVHALNCLKDIFVDARLGPSTEPHMADTLDIAARCLESGLWAIRNCGLMLFKAIISRLNGGTDTASTRVSSSHRRFSRLAYEKYLNLPKIIYRLFNRTSVGSEKGIQLSNEVFRTQQAQRVFLALEIIGRSGLPPERHTEIQNLIREQMEGPIWAIRDKAARTLSMLIGGNAFTSEMKNLLDSNWRSQNALHGRLLCARFLVSQKSGELRDELEPLLPDFISSFHGFVTQNNCSFTAAAYIEFVSDILDVLCEHKQILGTRFAEMLANCMSTSGIMLKLKLSRHSSALLKDALKRCLKLIHQNTTSRSPMINEMLERAPKILGDSECEIEVFPDSKLAELATISPLCISSDQKNLSKPVIDVSMNSEQEKLRRNDILDKERDITNLSDFSKTLQMSSNEKNQKLRDPAQNDDDLRASGAIVSIKYFKDLRNCKSQKALAIWICKLFLAIDEHSELSDRLAAVDSISECFNVFRSQGFVVPYTRTLLGVFLALYDALLDDDEDVRDKAAAVVSILHPDGTVNGEIKLTMSLAPPVAASKLFQFLTYEFNNSKLLAAEAIYRLIGASSMFKLSPIHVAVPDEFPPTNRSAMLKDLEGSFIPFCPFEKILREVTKHDNVLFVQEKQNLFVDPVREADKWAALLIKSHPFEETSQMMLEFEAWTLNGLSALISAARDEKDGPLGWTSKPDVFTLGVRIILAAKVLLHWINRMRSREARSANVRELLHELLETGRQNLVHALWLLRIKETLEKSF